MVDRIDKTVKLDALFPKIVGKCRFCGKKLSGRRTAWCSKACNDKATNEFFLRRGYSAALRSALYKRDKGVCAKCKERKYWEADHIIELRHGGTHELSNLQTLCSKCHKEKTKANYV